MHIKKMFDKSLEAKTELDKYLFDFLIELNNKGSISNDELLPISKEIKSKTNAVISPFCGGESGD